MLIFCFEVTMEKKLFLMAKEKNLPVYIENVEAKSNE